jgi:membrane-associated phospholipid phosphatase
VRARRVATRLAPPGDDPFAADRVVVAYLAALAAVAIACQPDPTLLLARVAGLVVLIAAAARWRTSCAAARVAHDFLPVLGVVCAFEWTGSVVGVANPRRWDAALAAVDRALFGTFAERWFAALGRPWWLTDLACISYVAYYVMPVAIAVALYARGRHVEFRRFAFAVVTAFLFSYVCYFVLPASGPRVAQGDEARVLGGSVVSAGVRAFIRAAEGNQLDAFPSGHTLLSLYVLSLGWRLLPRWRVGLAAVTTAIVFSTVYLSFHYVVDVVVGAALVPPVAWLVPRLHRCAAREPRARGVELRAGSRSRAGVRDAVGATRGG